MTYTVWYTWKCPANGEYVLSTDDGDANLATTASTDVNISKFATPTTSIVTASQCEVFHAYLDAKCRYFTCDRDEVLYVQVGGVAGGTPGDFMITIAHGSFPLLNYFANAI